MGKIVKYCNACEEGFAEKFGFCPNCGAQLTAFEMNPLLNNAPTAEPDNESVKTETQDVRTVLENPVIEETPKTTEVREFSADENKTSIPATEEFKVDDEVFETPVEETKSFETDKSASQVPFEEPLYQSTYTQTSNNSIGGNANHYAFDGGYQPTIVVEKNVKERNSLLLGFFVLGCLLMIGGYVYSIFNKYLDIAAIDTPSLLAYVSETDPVTMELKEPEEKKINDKGGGGGGGGKEEETQASKGREATQVDNPLFAPSSKMDRLTDPTIAIRAATKGNREAPQTDENYGLPQGLTGRSDGTGSGGGLGEGRGRGQGTGNGEGLGSGNGSGYGGGNGNGNGNGNGDGDDGPTVKTKTPAPVGPTEGVKILSKPKALYTDAARQANVQGKVVLRVTFTANGSIGAISVISGLGNGLTEQAIAAARGIRFEPAKRGGVAYTVSKPVEYSFTIY